MEREKDDQEEPLPDQPIAFLWRYVLQRPWHFGGMLFLVVGAASCAVAVQYGMKLLVDVMTLGDRASAHIWFPFSLFIGLIVLENIFWRLGGWLGCRTVVASCADLRVDLFSHLTGHPMRYFSQHFAGALANRISSAGAAAGRRKGRSGYSFLPSCRRIFRNAQNYQFMGRTDDRRLCF
jgi:ATP-binding cassette subfamily B protein